MIVTIVHVDVKPEFRNDFITASIENHQSSIKEVGNCRFDILQDPENENHFLLYEAYESQNTANAHKETQHYLLWRQRVAHMMAQPRKGVPYKVLAPCIG
jgi:(4S)-4-hydroxy-5-phosphonooxypentane-2,3-dione isomerase